MKQCGILAALCRNLDCMEEEMRGFCRKKSCKRQKTCKETTCCPQGTPPCGRERFCCDDGK